MKSLGHKLARDTRRLLGQVITISLVIACGVMALIMMRSTYGSLVQSKNAYYRQQRFADVFARLESAPDSVATRLERIEGVARAYPRLAFDVMVPIEGEDDVVTGRILSIPDSGPPPLNGLHLTAGRLPAAGATDEVVVLKAFADAHTLGPGDRLPAVLNGVEHRLRIVGVALSPEFVIAVSGQHLAADERLFAVLWMPRSALAPIFAMEGAFNDVSFALEPGARLAQVRGDIDRELTPYGGVHAIERARQPSNFALRAEMENLQSLAILIPAIFLAVAAFLVNVVVSRLVYLERTQIAVLKAVGYTDARIGLHYLALVGTMVLGGGALGIALGVWSGRWMTSVYTTFYKFPTEVYSLSPRVAALALSIAAAAAFTGALSAVGRVARMPPAQAMRPPTPLSYRRAAVERLVLSRLIGPSTMMVAREIGRRPLRFLLSVAAIGMGVAIFVMGRFSWDSFDHLFEHVYRRENREHIRVDFSAPRPQRSVGELEHIFGVELAEGIRAFPVRFRVGHRWRDGGLLGYSAEGQLHTVLHRSRHPVDLPVKGVVMTDKLAEVLGIAEGDQVEVELLEPPWSTRRAVVARLIDEPFGLQAYARKRALHELFGEEPTATSALLRIHPDQAKNVRSRLKELPQVIASSSTERVIENFEEQTGESFAVITLILTLSAAAISVGVVYNNARIALSLRSRDLASLRVLGFTRREISSVLLGELATQVALGTALGLWVGTVWARAYVGALDSEAMRFPLHIAPETYASAALIALVSGVASALLVRRRLDDLDLIAVLKSAE